MNKAIATNDVLKLRERREAFYLRKNKKYEKLIIVNGQIQNNLSPRELSFVKANLPEYLLN